jgi:hypothetical protein
LIKGGQGDLGLIYRDMSNGKAIAEAFKIDNNLFELTIADAQYLKLSREEEVLNNLYNEWKKKK